MEMMGGMGAVATTTAARSGIEVRAVDQVYGDLVALDGIDLSIREHTRLGVVGPSGCGKSTLLSVIAGLIEPTRGTIAIGADSSAGDRLARCALMPQRDLLMPWRTALDNACIALENRGLPRHAARDRARPLFERFGLAEFEQRFPHQLSGGMRQRVAFLRTLMPQKDVLLLDEPFGALDSITRGQMQDWLVGALELEPRTVLLVTHDVDEALLLTDHVVVMSARPGRVVRRFETGLPGGVSRRELVTSSEFAALKDQALEALGL